jgi:hypothetical protein
MLFGVFAEKKSTGRLPKISDGTNRGAVPLFLLMAAVIISPLFFGAIHTYAYTFAFLCIVSAGLLILRQNVVNVGGLLHFRWPATGMNPLLIFFILYLILQMTPLPSTLLAWLSPDSKVSGDMSHPAVAALEDATFKDSWYALAPYLYPVRMSLVRWIVYGLLFLGLTQTLNSRRRIETAIILIVILCCFETLYGIIQTYSSSGKVLWFKYRHGPKSVGGTYLNYNHFAGLIEMGIILAIAYAGALSGNSAAVRPTPYSGKTLRKRILHHLPKSKKLNKRFVIIFAAVIMGIGLILSASRGGIISATGALLVMGFLFSIKQDYRRKRLIIFLFSLLTAAYALYIGIDYTVGRFYAFDMDFQTRMEYANQALRVFGDYSLAGTGIGNYRHITPRYGVAIDYAHNDWAQFMAEAGTAGGILLLSGLGWYVFTLLKKWVSRSDPFSVCLGIAPVVAMTSIGIHSLSDFNLHRPANFMMLVAVAAIGHSALHLERHHRHEIMSSRFHSLRLRHGGLVVLSLFLAAMFWSGGWTIRHFIAEVYCNTVPNPTMNLEQHPPATDIRSAISWDPGNAEYRLMLGRELIAVRQRGTASSKSDPAWWRNQGDLVISAFEDAVRLNPFRAEQHMRLGWEYSYRFDSPDYMDVWLPAADISMDRAAHFTGTGEEFPHMQVDLGNYWTMRSKTFAPSDMRYDVAWTKARWHYKNAMKLDKSKQLMDEITGYVKNFYPDEEHLNELL